MEEPNLELETFRQKWKEEVSAKSRNEGNKVSDAGSSKTSRRPLAAPRLSTDKAVKLAEDEEEDYTISHSMPLGDGLNESSNIEEGESSNTKSGSREPRSALEHYEKAVEKETQGSLGDSLDLYRKAFKLDHRVDLKYKNKHFPPSYFAPKPTNTNPSNASAAVPNTAHHSLDGPPQTIKELIAGFSGLSIEPAPPLIEGTPAPPCYLAEIPNEIVVQICREVAVLDVASFIRMAQVCKNLAYLVAAEESIWKRVCLGGEVGFGAMHYTWQKDILGGPLDTEAFESAEEEESNDGAPVTPLTRNEITEFLLRNAYSSSWQQMFRVRPRIRFNGCYISYINYIRPGLAAPTLTSWNSPIHIVTYYRYLRFFRDGTVISLQTTTEPSSVVHHLTKELLETHRGGASSHLASAVMQQALRGRWRLSTAADSLEADPKDVEGDVLIDTEAPYPKYVFRMELSLRSSGKGAKNNKLAWKGFWYYNKITDDMAEFELKNDKAFVWSRVKSYGNGA